MKLKYYLRGLGIGMLVVALMLAASGNVGAKMSDEAVKRRAAQLGMVEKDETVLGDIAGEDLPPQGEEAVKENEPIPTEKEPNLAENEQLPAEGEPNPAESGQTPAEEPAGDGQVSAGEEAQPEETAGAQEDAAEQKPEQNPETGADGTQGRADEVLDRAEEVAENAPQGRTVTLEVRRGDSSVSVAKRAAEVGLVRSAGDFDKFLCQNGYDKKISIGNYEIAEGASEKDIADIITRRR